MQDLEQFKNEMNLSGKNVYVGHRYVPKIMGEWDNTQIYEPLSIVQYQGNSFTSRQYVPVGVELTNEEYWASTGNYNAQIEQYRQDVVNYQKSITAYREESKINIRLIGVNVLDFGAKGDGVTDDTQAFLDTIEEAKKYNNVVIVPKNRTYPVHLDLVEDNIKFIGGGKLIGLTTFTDYILKITGDYNVIDGLEFEEVSLIHKPITIEGDYNKIINSKVFNVNRTSYTTVTYSDNLINIDGSYNTIEYNEIYNGRMGISLSNHHNKVLNNHIHDNITGVQLRAGTRYAIVQNNLIAYNDVIDDSGADGILGTRNVSKSIIDNNVIIKAGEHGIYFQGDNTSITNNKVFDCIGSGIKLASYNTGLTFYPGEVNDPDYIGHDNIIEGNIASGNGLSEGNVNAGIYLQSSLKRITVKGNITNGNGFGIRSVFTYENMINDDFLIEGNQSFDNVSNDYSMQTTERLVMVNNKGGNSSINNSLGHVNLNANVQQNIFGKLSISATENIDFSNNTAKSLSMNNNSTNAIVLFNRFTEQETLNISRIKIFNHNEVIMKDTYKIFSDTITQVKEFTNNKITFGNIYEDFMINFSTRSHEKIKVDNNTFTVLNPSAYKLLYITFNNSSFKFNIFEGDFTATSFGDFRGNRNLLMGNQYDKATPTLGFISGNKNLISNNMCAVGYAGTGGVSDNNVTFS